MQDKLLVVRSKDREVLRNIPVYPDASRVIRRLSFFRDLTPDIEEVARLVKQVGSLARPVAVYKSSPVQDNIGNDLKIEDIKFTNVLLRVNLKQVDRVFPYVVTCGEETEAWLNSGNLSGLSRVVNIIQEMILAETLEYLRCYITNRYKLEYLWSLQPGDMQAWPVEDRALLLTILGNVEEIAGVRLSSSGSLVPQFSACGIFYDTEMEFEGCQVCPQEPCMGRRAPYCEDLARKFSDRSRRPCGVRYDNLQGKANPVIHPGNRKTAIKQVSEAKISPP